MKSPVSILLVEDSPTDAQLIQDVLAADGFQAVIQRVEDRSAFEAALRQSAIDLILSDYKLPAFDGLTALRLAREKRPELPFILVSGALGEETAVESLRAGATDYVLKHRLIRLPPVVRRALSEAEEHEKRRCAEELLRESKRLYQSLVEQLPQCVFRKNTQGRFTFVNYRFCEWLGRPAEEVIGKADLDLFPHDLAGKYRLDDERILASGQAWTSLERHRPGNTGEERIVEVVKWPVYTTAGEPAGIQGIFWDVTERERDAEALRASERRLKEAERLAQLGSWEAELGSQDDLSRSRLIWSDETCRIFGYVPGSISVNHQLFFEQVHPDDRARVRAAVQEAVRGRKRYRVEHRVVRPDGSERLVLEEAEVISDPGTGGPIRLIGTVHDITEQRRAEEQLRKLAQAVEQSPSSIIVTDCAGKIEFVNPKFTEVTGYSAEEVLGKNPRILKGGEMTPSEYRQLWETISKGREWRGVFHNRRKDGTLFWETASISPIRDAAGKITHYVAVKEDVTEKRLTEAKLLRAQRMESIGSLASGIAHDLNNILTPIVMCAPLLKTEESAETRKELAEMLESSADRAVEIVKQLLSFARGKEGQKQPIQIRHLLRDMAKLARETFPRAIRVQESCATDLWPVIADSTHIHQVLLNLCVNARDAMPEGGHLILRAHNVILDDHFVSMHPMASPGPHVRLEVQDTGTGIPEPHQAHIFETFFTTKGDMGGTGLGLATVQGIVKDHKGFVTFTTGPGKGTTFIVHLPAVVESPADADPTPPAEVIPRGRSELVLVVDDETAVCETTRRNLERHGYRVLEAYNGIEGIAKFTAHQKEVRAVVTDFMMPLMDGAKLCRALRALAPDTPIIISSGGLLGKQGLEAMQAFEELGIQHILHKPHTAEVLLRTLAHVLGR